jgi:hypothetical protein
VATQRATETVYEFFTAVCKLYWHKLWALVGQSRGIERMVLLSEFVCAAPTCGYGPQTVMWALFNSPLIMSNDLPNIDAASKKLLLNREIIAINQDVTHPGSFNVTDTKTYCKNLAGNVIVRGPSSCKHSHTPLCF